MADQQNVNEYRPPMHSSNLPPPGAGKTICSALLASSIIQLHKNVNLVVTGPIMGVQMATTTSQIILTGVAVKILFVLDST